MNISRLSAAVCAVAVAAFVPLHVAVAVPVNVTPQAKVSITFDDGFQNMATIAAPSLKKYGLAATVYIPTNCIGMTTIPNTCAANEREKYMTWAQVKSLQTTYGWEVGSHTASHPLLASTDPTDQPVALTVDQVRAELNNSKQALATQGINATSFATPYGDYVPSTLAEIAKVYASHRGFQDTGYNTHLDSEYLIRDQMITRNTSVSTIKSYIDKAITNKQWLVLTFHQVKAKASGTYDYSTANLEAVAAYIKTKQAGGLIKSVNVQDGLTTSDQNLLSNASFDTALGTDWTTDAPANVVRDTGNNGNYPNATNSVKMTATSAPVHLFSPKVAVSANTTYILKSYANIAKLTSGQLMYYIDEYDVNGNWISGQVKKNLGEVFPDNVNFSYKPTSWSVASARLQIGAAANSGITAYIDNAQWFVASSTNEQPPVTPPPATQTNLVANGTFDAGISAGWTKNTTAIVADSANNGSPANPVNSVKLVSSSTERHLFSPIVAVENGASYSLTSYLDVRSLVTGGEIGFYIDEYDANGNWISGQYKTDIKTVSKGDVALAYTPSSTNAKGASLQIIVTAGSGTVAYYDDVRWYKN